MVAVSFGRGSNKSASRILICPRQGTLFSLLKKPFLSTFRSPFEPNKGRYSRKHVQKRNLTMIPEESAPRYADIIPLFGVRR